MFSTRQMEHVWHRFGTMVAALAIAVSSTTIVSIARAVPVRADAAQAVIGMPFSGKWAYNAIVQPPYTDSNSSHPSVHTKYYGDWATDVYAADGTAVTLQVTYPTTGATFYWISRPNGSCGQRTVIGVKVNGTDVGSVYFEHLNNAVTSGTITNGMTVGNVHQWTVNGSVCNPGPHVHVELKNTTNYACYVDHGNPGVTLSQGDNLSVLGSTNTGAQQACASVPSGSPPSSTMPTARPISVVYEGALNVFEHSSDNYLYAKYWDGTAWHGWSSLGSGVASDPAVIQNGTTLDVFVRGTDNQIYGRYFDPNSGWSGFASMSPVTMQGNPRAVWFGSRLYVFALSSGRVPYVDVWNSSSGWSGFNSLGYYMAGDLVPLVYGSELDIFTLGTDNAIWKDTTWDGVGWSGFASLGGGLASNPAVLQTGTQMLVWARNAAGDLWQDTFTAGVGWSNWVWMGGTFAGDPYIMTYNNDLEVYATAKGDGTVYARYYSASGQFWSGWAQLQGAAYLGSPTAIQYGPSELDVFAMGSDNRTVFKNTWNSSSGWGGFAPL
jgi:hypothetical protein